MAGISGYGTSSVMTGALSINSVNSTPSINCSFPNGKCICLQTKVIIDKPNKVIKTSFEVIDSTEAKHDLTIYSGNYRGIGQLTAGDKLNIQAPIPPNMKDTNYVSAVDFDPNTGKITFKFAEGEPEPIVTCSIKHAPKESKIFKNEDLKASRTCISCGKFNKWYRTSCWLCNTKLPFNQKRGEQAPVII